MLKTIVTLLCSTSELMTDVAIILDKFFAFPYKCLESRSRHRWKNGILISIG